MENNENLMNEETKSVAPKRYGRVVMVCYLNMMQGQIEGPVKFYCEGVFEFQTALAIANGLNKENKTLNTVYTVEEVQVKTE